MESNNAGHKRDDSCSSKRYYFTAVNQIEVFPVHSFKHFVLQRVTKIAGARSLEESAVRHIFEGVVEA